MKGFLKGIVFITVLFSPLHAFAVQEHAGAEGLVAHELAHLFFILVSLYLLFVLRRPQSGFPHRELRLTFLFFLLWNLITFLTHLMRERVNPEFFTGSYLVARDGFHYLWYAGSIVEHFFLIGACLMFLKTLVKLKKAEQHSGGQ